MKSSTARPLANLLLNVRPARQGITSRRRLVRVVRVAAFKNALWLGAALVVLGMVKVWLRSQVTTLGYELSDYREMLLRLEHEHQELEIEMASLRDPRRVDDIARRQLGLAEPRRGQIVEVR